MKIFHISDLHIGKRLHLFDLSQVQRDVFNQIIEAAKRERPDVIVIAGDVYDKSSPSGEATKLLNEFFNELADIELQIPVLVISGNHDNNLRLNYASSFLEKHNIYISAVLPQNEEEYLKKITFYDEYGEVHFYMMPFVKPEDAKNLLGKESDIHTYDEAFAAILNRELIDYSKRNVLIAHQFFVSNGNEPDKRDSEMRYISVGGIDSVDTCHIEQFDYVALGHLHTSQHIGKPYIRYSGTPLKYSVSESKDKKSITVVTLKEKGSQPDITFIPLYMNPDLKKLSGTLQEVIAMSNEYLKEDYVSITLTDEESLFRPKDRLDDFYNKIIEVIIDNTKTKKFVYHDVDEKFSEEDNPLEIFCEFYQEMNGQPISEDEKTILVEILKEVKEE